MTIRSSTAAQRAQSPDVRTTSSWVPTTASGAVAAPDGARPKNVIAVPRPPATPRPIAVSPAVASSAFRVSSYEVAARVARGAMGSVYVCRDLNGPDPRRLQTMKVVRQHAVKQELAAASFRHEALVGSYFRHANAQTVITTGFADGQLFLILDYVEGLCLADVIATEDRPPPAVAVQIVLDVLAALQALHQTRDSAGQWLGLVHCDVSPENVLVGVDGVARLADFGSARFTARSSAAQAFALSKPGYMPPEQFRGERLDCRADLYSTGVLLWTALTGQQPFAADGYEQTVINVMRKRIKPPSASGAPACFDEICAQAMSRSPDSRFIVADAMATALRTTAAAQKLTASRAAVSHWVQQAKGDEIAQSQQRIEAAFTAKGALASGAAPRPAQWKPAWDQRLPNRGGPGSGLSLEETRIVAAPTVLPPDRRDPQGGRPPARLTKRDRVIIAAATALTFASTVAIGLGLTHK